MLTEAEAGGRSNDFINAKLKPPVKAETGKCHRRTDGQTDQSRDTQRPNKSGQNASH